MRLQGIPQHRPLPDYNLDPPDDPDTCECPTCGGETDNWTKGFNIPGEGWEPGDVNDCDECAKACPRCSETGVAKTWHRGWCQACVDLGRRGRKAIRKGLAGSRRERKLMRREYRRKGWIS